MSVEEFGLCEMFHSCCGYHNCLQVSQQPGDSKENASSTMVQSQRAHGQSDEWRFLGGYHIMMLLLGWSWVARERQQDEPCV